MLNPWKEKLNMGSCKYCASDDVLLIFDFGELPPANNLPKEICYSEAYRLTLVMCRDCKYVFLGEFLAPEILFHSDYTYFSSASRYWVKKAEKFVGQLCSAGLLRSSDSVIELASNDGYLLQFVKQIGSKCLGVEPSASCAAVAVAKGIDVISEFFCEDLARNLSETWGFADVLIANNVLAHVPKVSDFASGVSHLLAPQGYGVFEVQYGYNVLDKVQFDTVYHEHYSYLTVEFLQRLFDDTGLIVAGIREVETHGGSIQVWVTKSQKRADEIGSLVGFEKTTKEFISREKSSGIYDSDVAERFSLKVHNQARDLQNYLRDCAESNKTVYGFGAAAKASTILGFTGITYPSILGILENNDHKIGRYIPNTEIPVLAANNFDYERLDEVVVFPWNAFEEIKAEILEKNPFLKVVPSNNLDINN